jgi:hypothetical protein
VRATDGDMSLGGEDVDALLVNHMLDKFKDKTSIDIDNYPDDAKKSKAKIKLKGACAQLKVLLHLLRSCCTTAIFLLLLLPLPVVAVVFAHCKY